MEKKQLTLVVVSLLVVVLSVSVAYFTAQIIGEGKEVSVTSANLQVIFEDTGGAISSTDIEPGWTSTKTFTVKNSTKSEYKYNIVLKDLVNTFVTTGYLQYKITSTNSGYNMTEFKDVPKSATATDTVLAYNVSIPLGTTQTYTIEFKYSNDENVNQSKDMGKKLSGTLFITEGSTPTLYDQLLADKVQKSTARPDNDSGNASYGFSGAYTSDNIKTLYTSTENGTTVYYFAGNALDNWVKFGKYETDFIVYRGYYSSTSTNFKEYQTLDACTSASSYNVNCTLYKYASAGDDIYWRIIRTNADGGIRLLYHGTSTTAQDAFITTSPFNSSNDDPMHVGYMYGTSGTLASNRTNTNNSTIKTYIDSWYASNLTNYTKYLSTTAIYCNDREVGNGTYSATGSTFYYKGYTRLNTNKTPTYDCTNASDAFSVSNTSAKLTYPIGLMTADEISFAGGKTGTKAPAYYYQNSAGNSSTDYNIWYTMSPFYWYGSFAGVFGVSGSRGPGRLGDADVNLTSGVRPAISLKSCIKYGTGDGSANSPYTIDESTSEC